VTGAATGGCYYVTGASGFLGRRVCERLAATGEVRALFRQRADGPWTGADLVDLSQDGPPPGAMEGVDTVIHLAARTHAVDETGDTDAAYRAINLDGTRRMLEAAARAGVRRFVFVSSVKAMGEGSAEPQDEGASAAPVTSYGITKRAAESMVLDAKYTSEAAVLRPAMMYGPGAGGNVGRMIAAVRAGRFPAVPEVGNRRSLVHVADAADAVVLAANAAAAAGRLFIVTDGRPCSTREMYEWICEALGKEVPRRALPLFAFRCLAKAGDAYAKIVGKRWMFDSDAYDKLFGPAVYDSTAIETALGFKPRWDFRSALPEIVAAAGGSDEAGGD
jgi:nucleoside-diphosphate-sugar epimerase